MLALQPAQVYVACELVIAELEGVGAIVVPNAGKRSEVEPRNADVVQADTIGSRNLQRVQAVVAHSDVERRLRERHQAGIAEVGVDDEV